MTPSTRVSSTLPEECLSGLASRAMARLREERAAGGVSEAARKCLKDPLATALANALCDDGSDLADEMVEDLVEAGLTVEEICLDHLAPAARRLGEWWEDDRLPFTEVAMATARIQSMLRRIPASPAARRRSARGAVFCAVPGEQHTLGVMMAADLFRRHAWDVSLLIGLDHDEMMARLGRDDREVIGLSCSGDHSFAALRRLMLALRQARPSARLILSGQIASQREAIRRLPEPDAIVTSMQEAEDALARLERDVSEDRKARRVSVA